MTIHYSPDQNLYAPRIETYGEIESSLFLGVYKQAREAVRNVHNVSERQKDKKEIIDCNGIVAFTGDRGSGKTSAMLTVAELLRKNSSEWLGISSDKARFEVLPTVDPSHISEKETILDVVVSRLYTQFKDIVDDKDTPEDRLYPDRQRDLLKEFSKTHDAIRAHNQSREKRLEMESSIENLSRLAAGNDMRNVLYSLITAYLKFSLGSCGSNARNYLVICVDDLDLNINMGYNVCEEIRKFFNLPNIIVLFSVKLPQLTDLIKQKFYSDLKVLRDANVSPSDSMEDMASSYIDKLIPVTRRCAMPVFNVLTVSDAAICNEKTNYVDEILRLLFEKTGVILVKNRFGSHHFIPTNLRAMVHLYDLLYRREKVDLLQDDDDPKVSELSEKQKDILRDNLLMLDNYLREHSITANMPSNYRNILRNMLEINWEELNQRVARMIYAENPMSPNPSRNDGVSDICDPKTLPENVSIGDAFYMLEDVSVRQDTHESNRFKAIAKMIYSTRLVRLSFLNDDGYAGLRKLLGGLIYNPQGVEIVRLGRDFQQDLKYSDIKLHSKKAESIGVSLDEYIPDPLYNDDDDEFAELELSAEHTPHYFWIQLHTVSAGRSYSKGTEDPRWNRSDWLVPYYKLNNIITGSRYKFLTLSYLAFITNAIIPHEVTYCVDWFEAYNKWREKYITLIPVFSADIITHVINELRVETERCLKSTASNSGYYTAITKAIPNIIGRLSYPESPLLKKWIEGALKFPLWEKDWTFHKDIDGIWYTNRERKENRELVKGRVFSDAMQLKHEDMRILRERCSAKIEKIRESSDVNSLVRILRANINIVNLTDLPLGILREVKALQKDINITQKRLKNDGIDFNAAKHEMITQIQNLIGLIDNYNG